MESTSKTQRASAPPDEQGAVEALQRVTSPALAYLDLDELLAELLDRTTEILDADTAAILLFEEESGALVARAAKGLEEEVERGFKLPVGAGFAGRISLGGILVIIGIVVAILWSLWLGIVIALIGLIAFGGFARGRWY